MKLIKTVAIAAMVLLLAGMGLSYYTGYAGEQLLRQQLNLNREQAARQGYRLTLEEYQRGWFRSHLVLHLVPEAGAAVAQLDLMATLSLQHGPLLPSTRGWQRGLFALEAELDAASHWPGLPETVPLAEMLSDLLVIGRFGRHYQAYWTLPPLTLSQAGRELTLTGAELQWRGRYDQLSGEGELQLAPLTVTFPGQLRAALSDSVLTFELSYLADWMLEGRSQWWGESLHWSGPGQLPLTIEDWQWHWQQRVAQGQLASDYRWLAAEVKGSPIPLKRLDASVQVRGLPVEVLRRWEQLARERRRAGKPAFDALQWLLQADDRLRQQLRLTGRVQAGVGQGEWQADWRADYRGLGDPAPDLSAPRAWAELVDAELTMQLSESALIGTPLYWLFAGHFDRHWTRTAHGRQLNVRWRDGELSLNP